MSCPFVSPGSLRGRCSPVKPSSSLISSLWGSDVAWLSVCIRSGISGLMLKVPKTDSRGWYKKKWTGVKRNPQRLITVADGGPESQRFWYPESKQQGSNHKPWSPLTAGVLWDVWASNQKKCHDLQIKVCHFKVENMKIDVIILHLAKLWSLRWFGGQYFQMCY